MPGLLSSARSAEPLTPARFFVGVPLVVGGNIALPVDVAHHARVLRLRDGETVVLFNGQGGEYLATLRLGGGLTQATIDAFDAIERESPLELTLIQGLVAADKLDWIIEKAVELGAKRVLIAPMQRCVTRLDPRRRARRLQHCLGIARSAGGQCGRNRLPVIDFCDTLDAALAAADSGHTRIALVPAASAGLPRLIRGGATVLVGPEGGLAADELLRAERAGFVLTKLGPRILRSETAGLAVLASLQALSGDLAVPDL